MRATSKFRMSLNKAILESGGSIGQGLWIIVILHRRYALLRVPAEVLTHLNSMEESLCNVCGVI